MEHNENWVTVGEFARLTHLSAVTLRHYHDKQLLTPIHVEPHTGYRRYSTEQVADALLVSRMRAVGMPIERMRHIMAASPTERHPLLDNELAQLDAELGDRRRHIDSLRFFAAGTLPDVAVEQRTTVPAQAWGITADVARADIDSFCATGFTTLYQAVVTTPEGPSGPAFGLYSPQFFDQDKGVVTIAVPTLASTPPEGITVETYPAGRWAVTTHRGPYEDFDRTYGALGAYVNTHFVSSAESIMEVYVHGPGHTTDPSRWVTDVHWPLDPHRPS